MRLIIWRSLVQAQAGPQSKRLIPNGIQPFLFADPPDINLLPSLALRLGTQLSHPMNNDFGLIAVLDTVPYNREQGVNVKS